MIFRKTLFIILSLTMSASVYAIPPPDALISVWQSTLQLLGLISVFLVGFYYSLRQYLSAWKKPIIALALISVTGIGAYSYLNPKISKATPNQTVNNTKNSNIPTPPNTRKTPQLIPAENLSLDEVIAREPDIPTREWKLETYKEMLGEMASARKASNLPSITMVNIPSFTPQNLNRNLIKSPDQLFLLDVRAAYERKNFSLNHHAAVHYGDLIHSVLPKKLSQQLPKNKLIVVLCHSGLRGYIAANLLRQLGYKKVAFLQGGLAAWSQQGLPFNGKEDYSTGFSHYPVFNEQKVRKEKGLLKIAIDPDNAGIKNIPHLIHLPFEVATSQEINKYVQQSKKTPILIVCKSYGGCFHVNNFGYLIEQAGGRVAGVFDTTGQFVIPPVIEQNP